MDATALVEWIVTSSEESASPGHAPEQCPESRHRLIAVISQPIEVQWIPSVPDLDDELLGRSISDATGQKMEQIKQVWIPAIFHYYFLPLAVTPHPTEKISGLALGMVDY